MTITPDQAQQLLERATSGPWEAYTAADDRSTATYTAVSLDDREMVVPPRPGGMGTALDAHLIAAAPDLARTVIDQAEEIEKMRSTVAAFINKRPEYITALLASPGSDADYWRWSGHAEARRQIAQELGWTVPHNRSETTSQEADQ